MHKLKIKIFIKYLKTQYILSVGIKDLTKNTEYRQNCKNK